MAKTAEAERKTKPLKIRLTPATYAKLESLAVSAGTTLGGWIAIQIEAYRKPATPRARVRKGLAELRRIAAGEHG